MGEVRKFEKGLIIGNNTTGKTYFLINRIIKPILQNDPQKKVVIVSATTDDKTLNELIPQKNKLTSIKQLENWKGGGLVHFWDRNIAKGGKAAIVKALHELGERKILTYGAIIFDDATAFLKGKALPQIVDDYLSDYRHFYLDIYFVFHFIDSVPPSMWPNVTALYLKKTADPYENMNDVKSRGILNYATVYKVYKLLKDLPNTTPQMWTTYKINLLESKYYKV